MTHSSPDSAALREELATRIKTNPLGWLPIVGHCINVTFTPEEANILVDALRAPAQAAGHAIEDAPAQPQAVRETRKERLENEHNVLQNSYGCGHMLAARSFQAEQSS